MSDEEQWEPDDGSWEALDAVSRLLSGDQTRAVHHDRFDDRAWSEALIEAGSLKDLWLRYTRTEDYADEFLQDVFNLLMQGDPKLRQSGEMDPRYIPNQVMAEAFDAYEEVRTLRRHTASHLLPSVMAMLSMDSEIASAFEKMRRARELAEQLAQALQEIRELAEQARQQADNGEDSSEAEAAMAAAAEQAQGLEAAMQAAAAAGALGAAMSMRAGAARAADELREDAALAAGFGLEAGTLQRMDFAERRNLMQRLRKNRIAKFADLLGAFRSFAEAAWRRNVAGVPSETAGVTLGDDLTRLVTSELENLAIPVLSTDFYRRYASRELLVWEVKGRERQGRGPIVALVDESGSMQCADVGGVTREAWSKALVLALAETAHRQNRPMFYIGFSSPGQIWVAHLRPGDLGITIEVTEHFWGGGTHYEGALDAALQFCEQYHADTGKGRPDIVFVSDDAYTYIDAAYLAKWNEARERLSMVCQGVLIGVSGQSGAMEQLCDSVRNVAGIIRGGEVDAAAGIFGTVMKP